MKGFTTTILAAATLAAILVPAIPAAADDPCVGRTSGEIQRSEVAGVGPASVGTSTQSRGSWKQEASLGSDPCAPPACKPAANGVVIPDVGTPASSTPDVRALGQTVVPSTTIPAQSLLRGFTIPIVVPSPNPYCAGGLGVYARVAGIASVGAGADDVPVVSWHALP